MTVVPVRWQLRPRSTWVDVTDAMRNARLRVGADISASALSIPVSPAGGVLPLIVRAGALPVPNVGAGWGARILVNGSPWWSGVAAAAGSRQIRGTEILRVELASSTADALADVAALDTTPESIASLIRDAGLPLTVASGDAPPVASIEAADVTGRRAAIMETLARWTGGIALEQRSAAWRLVGLEQTGTRQVITSVPLEEGRTSLPVVRSRRGSVMLGGIAADVQRTTSTTVSRIFNRTTGITYTRPLQDGTRHTVAIDQPEIVSVPRGRQISDYTITVASFRPASGSTQGELKIRITGPYSNSAGEPMISFRWRVTSVPVGTMREPFTTTGPGDADPIMRLPDWTPGDLSDGGDRMRDLYSRSEAMQLQEATVALQGIASGTLNGLAGLDPGDLVSLRTFGAQMNGRLLALGLSHQSARAPALMAFDVLAKPTVEAPDVVVRVVEQGDAPAIWAACRSNVSSIQTRQRTNSGSWSGATTTPTSLRQASLALNTAGVTSGDTVTVQARAATSSTWDSSTTWTAP